MNDGETFDWSNLISKPELLELRDQKAKDLKKLSGSEDFVVGTDTEWPVLIYKYISMLRDHYIISHLTIHSE